MAILSVTTGSSGAAGSTAAELINDLRLPMLAVAEFDDMLEQYIFEPVRVTNAKTIQWNRMERLAVGTTPAQLSEGVAPKPVGLTINSVTATMEEYGNAVYISRLAQLTARNDVVQNAIRTLGYHVKELRDRVLYAIADAATNTIRVNDRANDNAIAVGDKLSFEEIAQFQSALDTAGAPKKDNGNFSLVIHTSQYSDLQVDANWLSASQFRYAEDIRRGFVGMILGVDVYKTNSNSFVKTVSATSGNSDAIRSAFIAGSSFAKVTDLQATEMHIQPPGQGSDWSKRRYQLGYTTVFKSVIVNQSFGRRIRGSSSDAAAVA